jgi:hypothetical protein
VSLVVGGCSSGHEDGPKAPEPPTTQQADAPTTTTTAATDAGTDVVGRYVAFWDARFAANESPVDPDAPALRDLATGSQLENVVAETAKRKADGLAFRRPEHSIARRSVRVLDESDVEATVQDCSVNDGVLYRVATGEIVDDSVVTNSVEAVLRLVDGSWKVESTRLLQKWEGVAGCALSS